MEGGEPRSDAVLSVSPLNRSVMPSSDAHCSKMDNSLYGCMINGPIASLFLQASQNIRDSGVDIRVEVAGGALSLNMKLISFSSSERRITKQASSGKS